MIGDRFQGPTGSGQGGWTSHRFGRAIGEPATFSLHAPIPLGTPLTVATTDDGWALVDDRRAMTVSTATSGVADLPECPPVDLATATAARARFEFTPTDHPVPYCFSCGVQPDSMGVHAGPTGDGRYATPWTVPGWAAADDGSVDEGALWAAVDCTAAFYVCCSRGIRSAVTVGFAVEVLRPLEAGATYALVGWSGGRDDDWDGRKRHAASAAFAADGTCVARSASFWIAID